jgi:integrase
MKISYILKGKNNPTNIICRINPSKSVDLTCATGIWINRVDWNPKQQLLRQKTNIENRDLINSKLRDLETFVLNKWNKDYIEKVFIHKNWLKEQINSFFGCASTDEQYKIYFIDWIIKFIQEAPKRLYKGKPINQNTIKQYSVTLKKLQAFENDQKTKLRFEGVDLHFYRNFVDYCRTVERLGDNSISGHIKNIKMWCKNIEIDGLPINAQYKHSEFSAIKAETQDVYLSDIEIDKIFNHDFKTDLRLLNARNHFIFGLRTGLRVSDFLKLDEKNIDEKYITITTKKTKQKVVIPVHQQVRFIIESNNNELPTLLSDQKFNEYIKEVCEAVGITQKVEGAKISKIVLKEKTETTPEETIYRKETGQFRKCELVTSHTCRRSFATNLYGKLPNKVIMAITGHRTEAQFLDYIKTTNKEYAEILEKHWEKEYSNELNESNNLNEI